MIDHQKGIKILSTKQIRQADEYTILNEPITSFKLMERASIKFVDWFTQNIENSYPIKIFCGIGNNGGDGLAIARMLFEKKYNIQVYIIGNIENATADFKSNFSKFNDLSFTSLINAQNAIPKIFANEIIIDGVFGSGLNRPIEGLAADLIRTINQSKNAKIISIDTPSGLFADNSTSGEYIIRANETLSFQSPKLGFLMPENFKYCENFNVLDINLNSEFINDVSSQYYFVNKELIRSIFSKRNKFIHKGDAGKCLMIAGSKGKIGAALLSTKACLRTGAGLVTTQIPKCGYIPMQTSIPEAMVLEDSNANCITDVLDMTDYDAIGIGPGLGTDIKTINAFEDLLKQAEKPLVIDADAINILSENNYLIPLIPKNSILTPHPGEFKRLVGSWDDDFHRLKKQIDFSNAHQLIVLLKGPYSSISLPNNEVFFNSNGNSGMATAGSGDVLTGIITSLHGQKYSPKSATILGAYLHGLSGDIYINTNSKEGLIASDLIDKIPVAIREIDCY